MDKTLDQIRREGLEALRERLGPVGMIRFLQQFETGHGDYARERHPWVDATTMDDLRTLLEKQKPAKPKRRRKA